MGHNEKQIRSSPEYLWTSSGAPWAVGGNQLHSPDPSVCEGDPTKSSVAGKNSGRIFSNLMVASVKVAERIRSVYEHLSKNELGWSAWEVVTAVTGSTQAITQRWRRELSELLSHAAHHAVGNGAMNHEVTDHRAQGRLGVVHQVTQHISDPPPLTPRLSG